MAVKTRRETMGRPKKRVNAEHRTVGVMVRGSKEWRDWVIAFADARRMSVTVLIDQSLVESAERHGFTKPAPKR